MGSKQHQRTHQTRGGGGDEIYGSPSPSFFFPGGRAEDNTIIKS